MQSLLLENKQVSAENFAFCKMTDSFCISDYKLYECSTACRAEALNAFNISGLFCILSCSVRVSCSACAKMQSPLFCSLSVRDTVTKSYTSVAEHRLIFINVSTRYSPSLYRSLILFCFPKLFTLGRCNRNAKHQLTCRCIISPCHWKILNKQTHVHPSYRSSELPLNCALCFKSVYALFSVISCSGIVHALQN